MNKKILRIILLLILLSGCQSNGVVGNEENSELLLITPDPGKGIINGKLIESSSKEPYEASLFLSKNLTADYPGYPPVISFSYQSNPRAAQDNEGNFVFKNIEPDKYVIVLYRPTGQDFIKDKDTGLPIMYELVENEVLNLGIIEFP